MPRVKIIFVREIYGDDYGSSIVSHGTAWEDVSDDEVKLLRRHLTDIPCPSGTTAQLLEEDRVPITERIESIKVLAKTLEDRYAAEAKKRAEAKRQRELARLAKTVKERKALFESLQKEFAPGA